MTCCVPVLVILGLFIPVLVNSEGYKYARKGGKVTPLDDYIARPEPLYGWTVFDNKTYFQNSTVHYLNVTTQEWMSDAYTDSSVWWHYVAIAIPHEIRFPDTGLIFVGGGNNYQDNIPFPERDFLTAAIAQMAEETGTVCTYFKQIPNQPIVFRNDPDEEERYEDNFIAYTWREFIDDPSNPEVLARLPMTKAIVKGMDAITEFVLSESPATNVSKYVIAGPSKRGWTTWTTAAVDSRVIAQAPMVLTCLDFVANLHHHYQAYGGWSFALNDYYKQNLTKDLDHPNTQLMMDIVDPYSYMDRYTMPTMVYSATEDQFFMPDDSHFFFKELPGTRIMMLLDNTEHSLFPYLHIYDYMRAFYLGVLTGYQFPVTDWVISQSSTGGRTTFVSDVTPTNVYAYWANTTDGQRRDFRSHQGEDAEFVNIDWNLVEVENLGGNQYSVELDNPTEDGYFKCFFVEAEYDGPDGFTMTLTSEINIVPNTFPFPDCSGEDCYGTIT